MTKCKVQVLVISIVMFHIWSLNVSCELILIAKRLPSTDKNKVSHYNFHIPEDLPPRSHPSLGCSY